MGIIHRLLKCMCACSLFTTRLARCDNLANIVAAVSPQARTENRNLMSWITINAVERRGAASRRA